MYKTEVIKGIKDTQLRADKITEVIHEQNKSGWDFERCGSILNNNLKVYLVEESSNSFG